jgi:hypothetical protein
MLRKLFALALLLLACSAFARVRAASHPDKRSTDHGTVSGTVSAVSGNLIQLAGGAIAIDAAEAKITMGRGQEATIADIKPGMQLFAAIRDSNPSTAAGLPATVITVTDPADLALSGVVQTVDAANKSFSLLNKTVVTDANTSFGSYKREAGTSFADLQPNVIVHVQADNAGGRLLAREVLLVAPAPPQVGHARGTVESIGTDSWTVKTEKETLTLVVNPQTKILGSPKVGDTVEVLYNVNSAHQYVAISILKFERPTPPAVERFHGKVKTIAASAWTVTVDGADRSFTTTESTKITPGIAVGDLVDVVALKKDDGTFVAVSIVKLRM